MKYESKVLIEIDECASEKDKPILIWLFSHYHMESQWNFVAKSRPERYGHFSYEIHRIWEPTAEGRILYKNRGKLE